MSNHVHFIVVPEDLRSLACTFGRTHADFARYANLVRRGCGHFWQARFYSCALDDVHAWTALAYVERNPVRAGIVPFAEAYHWSSAPAHCLVPARTPLLDYSEWSRQFTPERWSEALRTSLDAEALQERIREATRRGTPLGDAAFLERIGLALGRDVRPRPRGRPRPTP
jgi:putative transposase